MGTPTIIVSHLTTSIYVLISFSIRRLDNDMKLSTRCWKTSMSWKQIFVIMQDFIRFVFTLLLIFYSSPFLRNVLYNQSIKTDLDLHLIDVTFPRLVADQISGFCGARLCCTRVLFSINSPMCLSSTYMSFSSFRRSLSWVPHSHVVTVVSRIDD